MTEPTPETAVPDGPPRAVAEHWHTAALERSDGGRNAGWTMVGHVVATILSAMNDEQDELAAATARAEQAEAAQRVQKQIISDLRDERDVMRVRTAELQRAAVGMLNAFTHNTHPGYAAMQSRHVGMHEIQKWREAVWPTPKRDDTAPTDATPAAAAPGATETAKEADGGHGEGSNSSASLERPLATGGYVSAASVVEIGRDGCVICPPIYATPNADGRCKDCDGTGVRCRRCPGPDHYRTDHVPDLAPCRGCNGGNYPVRDAGQDTAKAAEA